MKFPVIISIEVSNSAYNHVTYVWETTIIDFENKTTCPLPVNNIDFSCGSSFIFIRVTKGYGILPSKAMKKAFKQLEHAKSHIDGFDWGKSDVYGKMKHFFKQGKYQ